MSDGADDDGFELGFIEAEAVLVGQQDDRLLWVLSDRAVLGAG
jgi:hypothetical protein